jgi:hypothetical protein
MPKLANERKRPQIGDVIEIETPMGLGYAQYTHEHREPPRFGSLLRVLPGVFAARPSDFEPLLVQEDRFSMFFPLGAALNRGIFRIVANEAIPETKRAFPTFGKLSADGQVWWMWDGSREWKARSEHQRTPRALRAIWNDTLLIERIAEQDWTPTEDDY